MQTNRTDYLTSYCFIPFLCPAMNRPNGFSS